MNRIYETIRQTSEDYIRDQIQEALDKVFGDEWEDNYPEFTKGGKRFIKEGNIVFKWDDYCGYYSIPYGYYFKGKVIKFDPMDTVWVYV